MDRLTSTPPSPAAGVLRGSDGGVLGGPPMVPGERLQLERGHSRLRRLGWASQRCQVGPSKWRRLDRPGVQIGRYRGAPASYPVVQGQRVRVGREHLRHGGGAWSPGRAQVVQS